MSAISLEDLSQQIAQRERELEALRQELESRRNQFTALTRRKEELLSQLQQVEAEIAALTAASSASTGQPQKAAPPTPSQTSGKDGKPTLRELILQVLRETGRAMTARQLSEEIQRRGFQLTGRNPSKSVESRLQEMKQKRLVQRASSQPGYILASTAQNAAAEKTTPPTPISKVEQKAAVKPPQSGQQAKQLTLRQALTNVLKNSRTFLSGSELAERVLASGYKTKSKQFVDAVWSMLGQMDNVEHVKGKGYRLKKT
jgi:regulator of replication initiation timing